MNGYEYMDKVLKMTTMCNHTSTETITKDNVKIIYCMECGKELHAFTDKKTCSKCGRTGDVASYYIGGTGYRDFCVEECVK